MVIYPSKISVTSSPKLKSTVPFAGSVQSYHFSIFRKSMLSVPEYSPVTFPASSFSVTLEIFGMETFTVSVPPDKVKLCDAQ